MSKNSNTALTALAQSTWDTKTEFVKAIDETKKLLKTIGDQLTAIECPAVNSLCFNLRELSKEYIDKTLKSCKVARKSEKSNDYIYIIRIHEANKDESSRLCAQLKEDAAIQKELESKVGYSRINLANAPSTTLYVGRSQNLTTRLRQHLGATSIKPYALHMQLWATNNDLEVMIDYMHFEDRDNLLVQAIEDGLWESLKPVFGRKGSK
ncbi:hypothetical protein [Paraburkholderia caribensis]|uniref:hypothetical protein n=1 Tax=Paraburkholderia caribensis TaxID=75105 RepID=UPI002090F3FA|nr:hypothetical protein [Paraburkholderia caribensis]MCO4880266.1 hypothetical protein [Paraburkholderia caribensis]